ncbi:fructose-bisphosphate aldolase [Candidatus Pacearchaeota archaeon]|nr:fructose-bisphosphate aldolase [Candidatus Pacearchaeota archaeon]
MSILKKLINMKKISRKRKFLFLAYDQGIEHGPTDFTDKNVDPKFIINIAKKGKFTGLIFHKGIAEKYNKEILESKIPLIVKLNGKTNLVKGEPISRQICSVSEAKDLGAVAVGYTIYIGSEYEKDMLAEFGEIQKKAHKKGLPVVCWIYPRGKSIKNKSKRELMAYATRVGLEIGADIIKIQSSGKKQDLAWAVKSAGKSKVIIAGGSRKNQEKLLEEIKEAISVGCSGLAIGRNIWQNKSPLEITNKIKKIIWK